MHPDMWWPLLVMIIAFYLFYAVLLMIHGRAEVIKREQRKRWVKELVAARRIA